MKMNAMHLFSEKYGDKVRVVTMGPSIEFCGGMHVSNTSKIDLFVIESDTAVSAGVRRIQAYTGMKAYEYLKEKQALINEAATILMNQTKDNVLVAKLSHLTHEQEDSLAHKLIDHNPDLVMFLAIDNGEKKDLLVACGKNIQAKLKSGNLMKEISKVLNGRGGGRPDCAFGGTNDLSGFDKAVELFRQLVK